MKERERREVLRELELAMRACRGARGARSSDLRELLSGISINGCLHCADRSYDDVLNRPCNVYVDVVVGGEVARIKRDLFRRNETYRGSFARYVKQVYFTSSLSRDEFMRLEIYIIHPRT